MTDYYLADVVSSHRLTPSMIRVELQGTDLCRFRSSGRPDEWVRLLFPKQQGGQVTLPSIIDGKQQRPEGPTRPYTVRRWDRHTSRMTVDFVAHEGGVASDWALSVSSGDRIGLTNAEGRFEAPEDADWILLFSDITGPPAVGRILEELPANQRVFAHLEIPAVADRQDLQTSADLDVRWHETYGHNDRPTHLLDIVRGTVVPKGNGYIWIAGEVTAASEARKHVRDVLGFDKDRITAVGYWIIGQSRG
jgi:NADPH-dependent ferric siderophore reductase